MVRKIFSNGHPVPGDLAGVLIISISNSQDKIPRFKESGEFLLPKSRQ